MPTAPRKHRESAKENGSAVVNPEQKILDSYAKKENMFMTKLSVLSQPRVAKPPNHTRSDAAMKTAKSGGEGNNPQAIDQSALFKLKNSSSQ